jgi:hypothetical protein
VLATTVTAQLSTTPRHKVTDTPAFANAAATAALVEPPTDSKASSRSSSAGLLLAAAADLMLQPLTTAMATAAIVAADHCPFHEFFPFITRYVYCGVPENCLSSLGFRVILVGHEAEQKNPFKSKLGTNPWLSAPVAMANLLQTT